MCVHTRLCVHACVCACMLTERWVWETEARVPQVVGAENAGKCSAAAAASISAVFGPK